MYTLAVSGVARGVFPCSNLCTELVTENKESKDVLLCHGARPKRRDLGPGEPGLIGLIPLFSHCVLFLIFRSNRWLPQVPSLFGMQCPSKMGYLRPMTTIMSLKHQKESIGPTNLRFGTSLPSTFLLVLQYKPSRSPLGDTKCGYVGLI